MEKIGIFCSASNSIDPIYFLKTTELGEWIGREGKSLIYGGSNLGLMECVAKAAKENGATVIGVVPSLLEENGRVSAFPDTIHKTKDLSDRKDIIMQLSDVFVALPGGVGTLDEVFHVVSSAMMGYHSKKVIFYNINGFYDTLLEFLLSMNNTPFARRSLHDFYETANTFEELKYFLNQ